jgi:isoquinoline 1-oxidoreductase beta subunit
MSRRPFSRREFLQQSGAWLGGMLVLSVSGPLTKLVPGPARAATPTGLHQPGPYVAVQPDGMVLLTCHRSEMGQHTRTAMTMLLAEELDVDESRVSILQADGDARYGDQNTDGSKSVRDFFIPLRQAGAAARLMLVQAAAQHWGVDPAQCRTAQSRVHHDASRRSLGYGELTAAAASLSIPKNPPLKAARDFQIIGKARKAADIDGILAGTAVYGQDVRLPGMVYASLERAPTRRAALTTLDSTAAQAVPGVLKVVRLKPFGDPTLTDEAVAVVATNTWTAQKARQALQLTWDEPQLGGSAELAAAMEATLRRPGQVFRRDGSVAQAKKRAAKTLEARYTTPLLVHAPMEPPACTAWIRDGHCEIWAPTQDPQRARKAAADLLGWPIERVTIHVTLLGGAFGRKSQPDFVLEAVGIARELDRPVKVVWSRPDEIRHGFYHAASQQYLAATLDGAGRLTGWHHRSVFPSIVSLFVPGLLMPFVKGPHDFEMGMGATNLPFAIPNVLVEGATVACDVRIAWYRSVCNLFHAYAVNSFFDEIAAATGEDPLRLYLQLLAGDATPAWNTDKQYPFDRRRLARTIETVATASAWAKPRPTDTAMGFAAHYSFKSYVAVALEARKTADGIQVKRVDLALDCGTVVNPDTVRAQMEGAIIFGLSAALHGQVTLQDGRIEQANFHDYPVLRLPEAPAIHVHLVPSDAPPTGVGEPGVPPVPPALCNALYRLTGHRFRELPVAAALQDVLQTTS